MIEKKREGRGGKGLEDSGVVERRKEREREREMCALDAFFIQ